MPSYSFLNVNCTLAGPTGLLSLGAGNAVAEEGISIEPTEDKNQMTIGADGKGQHALIASDGATITIRLLKTSPQNKPLMLMYNAQAASSALWGQNVMTITDSGRGDINISQSVAFKKKPTIVYDKAGPMMEWAFDSISTNSVLGGGQ